PQRDELGRGIDLLLELHDVLLRVSSELDGALVERAQAFGGEVHVVRWQARRCRSAGFERTYCVMTARGSAGASAHEQQHEEANGRAAGLVVQLRPVVSEGRERRGSGRKRGGIHFSAPGRSTSRKSSSVPVSVLFQAPG